MLTPSELKSFEREVAEAFNAAKIRAPVHLAGGNEEDLIRIFEDVRDQDWCFSTWRSHFHALLKGVLRQRLLEDVLAGRSITLCYPEHRFASSAIVAGALPIAVGVALSIKRDGRDEVVYAFLGDMAARTGVFHECVQYAFGHGLPIRFVVEDNGKSVCSDTAQTWGTGVGEPGMVLRYSYELPYPHSGAGRRIEF